MVCPYLLHVRKVDVSGPMTQLQLTSADRDDTFRLVKDLNSLLVDNALDAERLRRSFELKWPELESELAAVKVSPEPQISRSDGEVLSEILDLVRAKNKSPAIVMSSPADPARWLQGRIATLEAAANAADAFSENPEYKAWPTDEKRREWATLASAYKRELEGFQ